MGYGNFRSASGAVQAQSYVHATHRTEEDGGEWIAFTSLFRVECSKLIEIENLKTKYNKLGGYLVCALKLEGGSIWDPINGVRSPEPMQEGDTVRNVDIRREILDFARQMELRMREKDHVRGDSYKTIAVGNLVHALDRKIYQLHQSFFQKEGSSVVSEAADVANFAMMLAWHYKDRAP